MANTGMSLEGMDSLLARIQELGTKAARAEGKALKAGAEPIAEAMRNNVVVSSVEHLHIRDDIQVSSPKVKDGVRCIEVGPGKETNWRAKFLEFGTTKMKAEPFAEKSAREKQDESIEAMKDVLKTELGL